jgi:hypothetical protein
MVNNHSDMYNFQLTSNTIPKGICPKCERKGKWQRYIDVSNNELLPDQYGRCDREIKCGHSSIPNMDLNILSSNDYKNAIFKNRKTIRSVEKLYVPQKVYDRTKDSISINQFYINLTKNVPYPFNKEQALKVLNLYQVGTIDFLQNYHGAVCFPFIDLKQRIHGVQVKQFDERNHTTDTKSYNYLLAHKFRAIKHESPKWLKDYQEQTGKYSCLFGEHLLRAFPHNPIAIVEAPKTAIYASLYFGVPKTASDFIWLATGSLSYLTKERMQILSGRSIMLFPDLSEQGLAFEKWNSKANELLKVLPNTTIKISDFLEKRATDAEKENGLDLADYLIQEDWRKFNSKGGIRKELTTNYIPGDRYIASLSLEDGIIMADGYPASWDLNAPYLDSNTRLLISKVIVNPPILSLIKKAELTHFKFQNILS